eukprot:scaffold381266_cov27-Prasinocladus_malaysianus.AAC.1
MQKPAGCLHGRPLQNLCAFFHVTLLVDKHQRMHVNFQRGHLHCQHSILLRGEQACHRKVECEGEEATGDLGDH